MTRRHSIILLHVWHMYSMGVLFNKSTHLSPTSHTRINGEPGLYTLYSSSFAFLPFFFFFFFFGAATGSSGGS